MSYDDDSPDNLWRLAIHEVGHTVIYVVHGGMITALAARPWVQDGVADGYCEGEVGATIKAMGSDARQVHAACASLAGRIAESHFFGSVDDTGCRQDLRDFAARVQQVDASWGTGAPVEAWQAVLEELVRPVIAAHDGVIAYVAKALADERLLQEGRVRELFTFAGKLYGMQPGPLLGPAWRARLEAALARHRVPRPDAREPDPIDGQAELRGMADRVEAWVRQNEQDELQRLRDRMVARHGVRL
jgi:hypothetical protein